MRKKWRMARFFIEHPTQSNSAPHLLSNLYDGGITMTQTMLNPRPANAQPEIFVGRDPERTEFRRSILCVFGREQPPRKHLLYPHLFLVSGEDGSGKSALMRQFKAIAEEEHFPTQRMISIQLRHQRYPDAHSLAQTLFEAIAAKLPTFGQHYCDIITQRNNLLSTYHTLRHEWTIWQELGALYGKERDKQLQDHYRISQGRVARVTLLGAINRSNYQTNRLDWQVDDLRNILLFRGAKGHSPNTFEELLQYSLQGSAWLFQDDTALAKVLSIDLADLTIAEPLLLLIDDYEQADQHDAWLRQALFTQDPERLIVAIAGRHRHDADYRRRFNGPQIDLVRFYNLTQPLDAEQIKEYLVERLGDDTALTDVGAISTGIPLALAALGDQLAAYESITAYRNTPAPDRRQRSVIQAIVQSFLRDAPNDKQSDLILLQRKLRDRQRIRALALLLWPDPELVCELWGVTDDEGRAIMHDLADRYTFIFAGNDPYQMHPLVHEIVREELLARTRYTTEWQVDLNGLKRAHDTIEDRIAKIERTLPDPDDRYHNSEWSAATLELLNTMLWMNEDEQARKKLLNYWVEARHVNGAFADSLLDQAMELAPLTSEWRRLIQHLQTADYDLVQSSSHLLDPHMQAILAFKQAQPLHVEVISLTNLPRLNRHIELLEQSYALNKGWTPASDMLCKALAARGMFHLYEQNEPAEALKDFDAILAIRPHDLAARSRRGLARQRLKQPEEAQADFDQVLQTNPDDGATHFSRALLLAEQGQYQDALSDFDLVQKQYPKDPIVLQRRGETKFRLGNFTGARLDLAQALALRPKDPDLLISSAHVNTIKNDKTALDTALRALDRAITLRPDDPQGYSARGKLKYEYELADVDDALKDLNKSLELRPDHAQTLLERGRIYVHQGKWTAALADLDTLLELQPDNAAALTYRGVIRYRMQPPDLDGALADLDRSLDLQPGRITALDYRGRVKDDLDDIAGALEDFESVLAIDPNFFSARYRCGQAKYNLGRMEGAKADLDQALGANPYHPEALFYRGLTLRALKRSGGALADFDKSITVLAKQTTDHARSYMIVVRYWRGITHHERGRTLRDHKELQAAWEDFDEVARLAPDYLDVVFRRGVVAADLGRYPEAVANFDQALKTPSANTQSIRYQRGLAKARMFKLGALPDLWATVPQRAGQWLGYRR
jgi:tetratricopeptide (TPR) repeat protein